MSTAGWVSIGLSVAAIAISGYTIWQTRRTIRLTRERIARAEAESHLKAWDEARAKTEGGEWQWGVRTTRLDVPDGVPSYTWCGTREAAEEMARKVASTRLATALARHWLGPVEAVTDDGSGRA